MKTSADLRRAVRGIDHRGYPACKALAGGYQFDGFRLFVDHVQGDPFAAPSTLRVEVPHAQAGFPAVLRSSKVARRALADHLTRRFATQLAHCSMRVKGSGKSGLLATSRCGQEVLVRSACEVTDEAVVVRFRAGFPAFGRTVNGDGLETMLLDFVPRCVEAALVFANLDAAQVKAAVDLAEDQHALREAARATGLVAFVADGAVLPRESGASDLPMCNAVPFRSPDTLRRTFDLPHAGAVSGMGIPRGVTLIVGGGYHGKSTLLAALQNGVYDHVAGDGREFVITDETAVKLRAEDGRAVRNVDISPFINNLPNGADTRRFSTLDASGSTSQAAAVAEGLEAGCRAFLIDEDTSAANFMVRDELMQQVVARDAEPITPFVERVRALHESCGASTILVAGSSGAFFYVADQVIQMENYQARDITAKVRKLCAENPDLRSSGAREVDFAGAAGGRALPKLELGEGARGRGGRSDGRSGHDGRCASNGHGRYDSRGTGRKGRGSAHGEHGDTERARFEHAKVKTLGRDALSIGKVDVDVRLIEQIADAEQAEALAYAVRYVLENLADGTRTVAQAAREAMHVLDERGWKPFCGGYVPCNLAKPRPQELAACLNRLRAASK
ncbi:MAG: ABC-ATPase domain-containing protein [Eggerthellaceae bacterium]|nr:ABC-ATPase domain-containing protein [Eggerthellaceae bacterium]